MAKYRDAFQIEHGVPLPYRHVVSGGITDTLRKMAVGDSVLLRLSPNDPRRDKDRRVWHGIAAKLSVKIVTRNVDGGIRVWRIA